MVTIGDFEGKHEIAKNDFTQPKILSYIQDYEQYYAVKLLGVELYDLWVIDPSVIPFDAITNPFNFQSNCGKIYQSKGIRYMLTGFIYFNYVTDLRTQQTLGGAVSKANENSGVATHVQSLAWQRYNESVYTYEAIQAFIRENKVDYPTFRGEELEVANPYF